MRVLNYGSLNLDYVYQVPHILQGGETLAALRRDTFFGGKGLNQSIALARAGACVYHAGCIGEDGTAMRDYLRENGVNTDYIFIAEGPSGHTVIQVDEHAQNCILLWGGANRRQRREQIDRVLSDFGAGDFLLLQNEINEIPYLMEQAHRRGMRIALNPSPIDEELMRFPLEKADYLLLNEIEGNAFTGETQPEEILRRLSESYPGMKILLTLGGDGCLYWDGTTVYRQGIYPVEAVDTTAAGDTFTGYFLAGILEGRPTEEILRRSAKAAGIAVSRKGAAPSIPTADEL